MNSEKKNEKLSIEESFEKLEEILEEMEKEDTGLEASFRLYEKGIRLLKDAEDNIEKVEKQIRVLNREEPVQEQQG